MRFPVRLLTTALSILLASCASSPPGSGASVNYARGDGSSADPIELGAAFSKCRLETAQNPMAMNACMSREGYTQQ
jgi:hypothetical protein